MTVTPNLEKWVKHKQLCRAWSPKGLFVSGEGIHETFFTHGKYNHIVTKRVSRGRSPLIEFT